MQSYSATNYPNFMIKLDNRIASSLMSELLGFVFISFYCCAVKTRLVVTSRFEWSTQYST